MKNLVYRLAGPSISGFTPAEGRSGCTVTIQGSHFSATRDQNQVRIGGQTAVVVTASASELVVITDRKTTDGPVEVTVGSRSGKSATEFRVLPYPGDGEDGPPIVFTGAGEGLAGELPASGRTKVLVALVNPTDRVPGSTARQTVIDNWTSVRTFYDEASFTTKDLEPDVMATWTTLTGSTADYVDFAGEVNVKSTALPRLYAEAAKAAQAAGKDLNTYGVLAVTLFLNNDFIRGWNSGQTQSFYYDPGAGGTPISISLTQGINQLAVNESADWGRLAHEFGHGLVDKPTGLPGTNTQNGGLVFGEDVYDSDLVDPLAATAHSFDLMGDHDSHPLFSAYFMEQLGWYRPDNPSHDGDVLDLDWDRNPKNEVFEIVAHGGIRNTVAGRYHAIKIKVAAGLFYYLEVRQRPAAGGVIFDDSIPVGTAPNQGGLVVTKVVTDTVNNNQQYRFITLLHDMVVLKANETAIDPARALTITVLDDGLVARPLVCRVRVEWAQGVVGDPNGAFDLSVTPWDTSTYTTPDVWVDRKTYGTFDQTLDAQGRPQLNGDKPKPGEINKINARINCSGTVGATNVKVTYYVVEPPGIGDNGNWAPLITRTIAAIPANGFFDLTADWVPLVGRHTCLKVYASPQFGEVSGGDNWAQENVSEFEAPAFSPPAPVVIPLAVRNPRDEATVAMINIIQVPRGYMVQFPHAWLHLQGHEERLFDLIVIPLLDVSAYIGKRSEAPSIAPVRIEGRIPRQYAERLSNGDLPASTHLPIGGVLNRVRPVRSTSIELSEDDRQSEKTIAAVHGAVSNAHAGDRLRVLLTDETGRNVLEETTTDDSGYFEARLNLEAITLNGDASGTYSVQAHTFAADTVAEASSNVVTIFR